MAADNITDRKELYTDTLGDLQIKTEEAIKWGMQLPPFSNRMRKAFIYLNTLSRYNPGGSNSITEQDAEFILLQLEKLLPC